MNPQEWVDALDPLIGNVLAVWAALSLTRTFVMGVTRK